MADRSMGAIPLVLRVKTKEELVRLKQLECLVRDLGKEVIIRYLEYLVHDTQKVVQCQVPKIKDKEPTPAMSNADKVGPLQDMNKPKVEILGKFSYNQFLSKDSNKITFEEFITAAHRWGTNVVGATADDLKGYLLHLSLISAMASTQRYDQQMHVNYDKAIRKQAEEVGWAAFKADNTTVANLYYDTEHKEQNDDELDQVESESEHCSLEDTVMVDNHQSAEASETVDLHHEEEDNYASHENLTIKEESDVKDRKWQSFSTVSTDTNIVHAYLPQELEGSEHRLMKAMCSTPAILTDSHTEKLDTLSDESSAHSSLLSNQPNSDVPEALVIPKRNICSYCRKGFGSATTLKVHLRRHAQKPPAKKKVHLCSFCGRQFGGSSQLKSHLMHHTGERPYPCTECGEKLISARTLREHMMRHTGNKQYICSYCGKQFYSSSALTIHTRIHTGEKPHVCPYCGKGFRGSGYMKSHMLVHTQEKQYKCSKCDRGFSIHCNLKRHMLTHTGEKPYKCPHCSMACTRQSGLKTHIELYHMREGPSRRKPKDLGNDERPHSCSDCGKQYRYLSSLKVHMISHTGGNPLTCPDCDKKFRSTSSLRYHMMSHTGEKPYECKECGKGFPSSGNLDVHALIHTGEKPYVCSDCGKTFSAPANLQKHKRIHTGEKGFSRAADLRKHKKVHGERTA